MAAIGFSGLLSKNQIEDLHIYYLTLSYFFKSFGSINGVPFILYVEYP